VVLSPRMFMRQVTVKRRGLRNAMFRSSSVLPANSEIFGAAGGGFEVAVCRGVHAKAEDGSAGADDSDLRFHCARVTRPQCGSALDRGFLAHCGYCSMDQLLYRRFNALSVHPNG
jgi:hypothetical protein